MKSSTSRSRLRRAALTLAAVVACSVSASAQVKPTPAPPGKPMTMDHGHDMKEPASGWKELDAFHELMAASWHPASGTNNLAPAKAKAADMAKAAKTWAESKAPNRCDTPKIKEALTKVQTSAEEFAGLVVKGTDDAALKTKLSGIHDMFEVAEMGCKPEKPPTR